MAVAAAGALIAGGRVSGAKMTQDSPFPTCTEDDTSEFMGTIDGMPYHTKDSGHITAMAPPRHPPYTLSMKLAGEGSLDLMWGNPYIRGQWTNVAGEMILPEGGPVRGVYGDSQLLFSCDEYAFLFILVVDGGKLTGCSH